MFIERKSWDDEDCYEWDQSWTMVNNCILILICHLKISWWLGVSYPSALPCFWKPDSVGTQPRASLHPFAEPITQTLKRILDHFGLFNYWFQLALWSFWSTFLDSCDAIDLYCTHKIIMEPKPEDLEDSFAFQRMSFMFCVSLQGIGILPVQMQSLQVFQAWPLPPNLWISFLAPNLVLRRVESIRIISNHIASCSHISTRVLDKVAGVLWRPCRPRPRVVGARRIKPPGSRHCNVPTPRSARWWNVKHDEMLRNGTKWNRMERTHSFNSPTMKYANTRIYAEKLMMILYDMIWYYVILKMFWQFRWKEGSELKSSRYIIAHYIVNVWNRVNGRTAGV